MLRAESILAAVETVITGLTTTGTRVFRAKVRTIEVTPSLSFGQGGDDVSDDRSSFPVIHRDLNVKIFAHVKTNTAPETQMNLIREEVYLAMMADNALGLTYIVDIVPIGDDEPEITGDADQITGRLQMNFIIKYTHSWTNAGA